MQRKKNAQNVANAVSNLVVDDAFEDILRNAWHQNVQEQIDRRLVLYQYRKIRHEAAKNIILFVRDGMSVGKITASCILVGQLDRHPREEGFLSFGYFPYSAFVKT